MTFLAFQRPGLNIADQGRGRFPNKVGEVKKQWCNLGAGSWFLLRELPWALQGTNEPMNEFWTHGSVLSWRAQSVRFSSSVASDSATPWTAARQASQSITNSLPEFTQTHGDAIQPYHPLSSPSPPAFNLFQHQGLFKWVSSLQQVAKVLEFQLQQQSFQWIFRTDFL